MARYRVSFSREWIRGRWGFIDRFFHDLGGRVTEPSRTENAWFVEFKGNPRSLGRYLSDKLELRQEDLHQFGAIFEIEVMEPLREKPAIDRSRAAHVKRLTAGT